MTDTFDIGNIVRLSATFRDLAGTLVDPGDVVLYIRIYAGETQQFTFAADEVKKLSIGIYYYDFVPTESGKYYYRYYGSNGPTAAADGQFSITASPTQGDWPSAPAC